jgi:hypothetical protein
VKQQCLSDDFIVINDKWKRLPWVLCVSKKEGKRAKKWRDRERENAREAELLKRGS